MQSSCFGHLVGPFRETDELDCRGITGQGNVRVRCINMSLQLPPSLRRRRPFLPSSYNCEG